MQQIIVSRNDKEDVWVATPTGNLLAECFFKAPDETPEEVEHHRRAHKHMNHNS